MLQSRACSVPTLSFAVVFYVFSQSLHPPWPKRSLRNAAHPKRLQAAGWIFGAGQAIKTQPESRLNASHAHYATGDSQFVLCLIESIAWALVGTIGWDHLGSNLHMSSKEYSAIYQIRKLKHEKNTSWIISQLQPCTNLNTLVEFDRLKAKHSKS